MHWLTDAACVRFLKTFRIMPWPYKVLDLSFFLAPTLWTLAAYLHVGAGWWGYSLVVLVVLYWLFAFAFIFMFVRGYSAERRGVEPSPPSEEPNLGQQRGQLIFLSVFILIGGSAFLGIHMYHPIPLKGHDWTAEVALPSLFFQQVSTYARNRFWNASFE
jgi:hypothetical protein